MRGEGGGRGEGRGAAAVNWTAAWTLLLQARPTKPPGCSGCMCLSGPPRRWPQRKEDSQQHIPGENANQGCREGRSMTTVCGCILSSKVPSGIRQNAVGVSYPGYVVADEVCLPSSAADVWAVRRDACSCCIQAASRLGGRRRRRSCPEDLGPPGSFNHVLHSPYQNCSGRQVRSVALPPPSPPLRPPGPSLSPRASGRAPRPRSCRAPSPSPWRSPPARPSRPRPPPCG